MKSRNGSDSRHGTYTCPECGGEFETRRGVGVHHTHIHDSRLPDRECDFCNEKFYSEYAKKYCSRKCLVESWAYAGENHPNYRGGKEKTKCEICGAGFEYYPSEKKGLYCSDCVETEDWRDPPRVEGPDHPRRKGGKSELLCDVCDGTVERHPFNIAEHATVCSESCRHEWLSESFTGDGDPNWKGGGNEAYGKGWDAVRTQALERDGYECRICGKSKDEIGRNPDVHHIEPVRSFVESEDRSKTDAHTADNVITLCIGRHRKADFGKIPKSKLRSLID